MIPRQRWEQLEYQILSAHASFAAESKGRRRPEEPCAVRTAFQRDRDRIVHSKSFRRLKHKTQVFITPEGDHYRTRLTHTLEVSQIARTIARALRLNEDLTEAIADGHDLGHTPFGHSGEQVLREICPDGFTHYEQSLRVVDVLENGRGLNLTWEVRDGIVNHTGTHMASTLEGVIVKFADRIAYLNHDIDDALRGGVIREEEIPREVIAALGPSHSARINTMICDVIRQSENRNEIRMSDEIYKAMMDLRTFMYQRVYVHSSAKKEEEKAQNVLRSLYGYFTGHLEELPQEYRRLLSQDAPERVVCDYIAGMTDSYALHCFNEIFVPKSWKY